MKETFFKEVQSSGFRSRLRGIGVQGQAGSEANIGIGSRVGKRRNRGSEADVYFFCKTVPKSDGLGISFAVNVRPVMYSEMSTNAAFFSFDS